MFIQTEAMSNPEQMKFLPDRVVLPSGTADFPDVGSSTRSPLAQRLFEIEGVTGVRLNSDSITLSKAADTDWPELKSFALNAIMSHFTANEPVLLETAKPATDAGGGSWSRVKKLWQHARGGEEDARSSDGAVHHRATAPVAGVGVQQPAGRVQRLVGRQGALVVAGTS